MRKNAMGAGAEAALQIPFGSIDLAEAANSSVQG